MGIETIVKKAKWIQLKDLNISENEINDKALAILCQGNWPLLKTLNLKNTGVTKRALFNFVLNSNCSSLEQINFGKSGKNFVESVFTQNWGNSRITQNEIDFLSTLDFLTFGEITLHKSEKIFENLVESLLQKNWFELKEVNLSNCGITQKEVEVMVNKGTWSQLEHLNVSENNISNEALEILCQGDWPRLEIFNLRKTKIKTVGIETIVKKSKWAQIKQLNLSYNEIDDEGLQILAQENWPLLETLNLEKTAGTKKGLLHLISNPKWVNLQELKFGWNGENTAKNLVQKNWHLLEELDLSDSRIAQNELELIVNECNWPQLKHLNLSSNHELNDEGLAILCQGNWPMLETLNLENTGVTKRALLSFLLYANWPNLKTLLLPKWWNGSDVNLASRFIKKDLSQMERLELNNLKTDFAKIEAVLSRNKCLKLKYLNISDNEVSQEGKVSLLGITECPLLEELHLKNTKLTSNEIDTILNQFKLVSPKAS